jgi:hypothetical protein
MSALPTCHTRRIETKTGRSAAATCRRIVVGLLISTWAFFYSLLLVAPLGLAPKAFELAIAGLMLLGAPPLAALILRAMDRGEQPARIHVLIGWACLCSCLLLLLLVGLLGVTRRIGADASFWLTNSFRLSVAVVILHAAGSVFIFARVARERRSKVKEDSGEKDSRTSAWLTIFVLCLSISLGVLFHIEPANPRINPIIQVLFQPSFPLRLTAFDRIAAIAGAAGIVGFAIFVASAERKRAQSDRFLGLRHGLIPLIIVAASLYYFDFSLHSDPMHYLTNISPAIRVLNGGVPLVDTFSQYGPGPILMTVAAFALGPTNFGSANILVQIHNLVFFTIILLCLCRLVQAKIAALILGMAAIGVLYGAWGAGYSSLASAPSNMGFRYLWPAAMTLAIAVLNRPQLHSFGTVLSTAGAALWSIEALAFTLAIHLAVIAVIRLRVRDHRKLPADVMLAIAPAVAAVAIFSAIIFLWSGSIPDYLTYLRFLAVYNAFSDYWGIPSAGTFWGWAPLLLTISVVATFVWTCLFDGPGEETDPHLLLKGYFPLAVLTALIALYYLGRSVDFTLMLAFLPFSAIVIAVYLGGVGAWRGSEMLLRTSLVVLSAAMAWALVYGMLALYRPSSPYRLAWHECRYEGRCSPNALATELRRALYEEPRLGSFSYIGADGEKLVSEAVQAVAVHAGGRDRVALFLGKFNNRSLGTDLALLYAGRTHRWPVSYTFTDELVSTLAERIAAAPIYLGEGETVIVRRDETALGSLERSILAHLRGAMLLCAKDTSFSGIVVFRATRAKSCSGS